MGNDNIVYPVNRLVTAWDGQHVVLREGDPWDADHPLVKARPHLFSPAPSRLNGARVRHVEDTTMRPGEKRGARGR